MTVGPLPTRMLLTTDAVGGVWQFSMDLAQTLSRAGVAVDLAVLGPEPSARQVAEASSVPNLALDATGLPLDWTTNAEEEIASAARNLAGRAARADLVHLNHPAYADAYWPAPVISVVHSCHGSWWATMRGEAPPPPDFRWRFARMRRALAASDRVAAPSAALAEVLNRIYRPPRPLSVVRNGRMPARTAAAARASGEPFVLTAGRLWDEAKDIATLDAAAPQISAPVIAAGAAEGPNGERVRPLNLALAGELTADEIAAHHRSARVFVSTARYEPFGLAVLEAAQAARPLVLSDIRTFRELWEGAALFVPPADSDALARQVNRLLADPAEAARWGARAARRAGRYTVARMVEGYGRLYSAVLAEQQSRLAV